MTRGRITAKGGVSVERFASVLANQMDRPVVNETGIEGLFDFVLEWKPDDGSGSATSREPAGPSLFTALQETLGLRLETQKVPLRILTVDRAGKPGEN